MKRTVLTLVSAFLLASPVVAQADPGSCTATPGSGSASNAGTATCPAHAGDFWFRVAVDCYDAYPSGLRFIGVGYGPWKWAGGDTTTTSSVPCNGAVPGSGVAFNGRLEVR
ncbi:hypothetical protein [Lentzea aerocolonigenes]|uniref:hypothetical protein n=1 Tax=Lentzea aerocolonigenes TaxID=68170 RepID=UPI0012E0DDFE|nr:hypothetical protein [Lentzea aerocolonigenes]